MIPQPHRIKGGSLQLGAKPGEVGPFGPYGADEDTDPDQEPTAGQETVR